MSNENNLVKFNEMDEAKHKELSAKGGRNSGKAKRKKKAMKSAAREVLNMTLHPGELAELEELASYDDLRSGNITVQDKIIWAMAAKAMAGDVNAAYFLRDTMGEHPTQAESNAKTRLASAQVSKVKAETEAINKSDEMLGEDKVSIIDDIEKTEVESREDNQTD